MTIKNPILPCKTLTVVVYVTLFTFVYIILSLLLLQCNSTTVTQAEGDDFTTANDFRQVGIVKNPTQFGSTSLFTATTGRQTKAVLLASNSGNFDTDEKITHEGQEYPLVKVEISSSSHPFYSGKERSGGTTGRIEKFNKKYKIKQ